ncbi:MAG: hypothetical protein U0414_04360 [Polyangiaceae bacterium]
MRSRPTVKLYLTPNALYPGSRLEAELVLTSRSDTPCNGIRLTLRGQERRYRKTVRSGNTSRRVYHEREVVALRAEFPAVLLSRGDHTRKAVFDVPHDAPPSYKSDSAEISYEIAVHVDIPWWPDRRDAYVVRVLVPPSERREAEPAARYTSHPEPEGKDLFIEASLETLDLVPGQNVEGAVSLANVAHHRVKGVDLALVAIESPLVQSSLGPAEVLRSTWTLVDGKPSEGQPVRFAIEIPKAETPDFETPFISLTHSLEVRARISLGRDQTISLPARVSAAGSVRKARKARPAALGSDKRAANWQRALAALGRPEVEIVSVDPVSDEAVLASGGRTLRVSAELRGDEGSFLVARAAWPSLGLGLSLRDRRWKDLGGIDLGGEWDERFVVRGRDPEQIKLFLDARTRRYLEAFADVSITDREGYVAVKGSSHKAKPLGQFLGAAIDFDAWLGEAYASVPPPPALADAAPAWSDFASKWGATFHPGDFSIDDLDVSGLPMRIRQRFAEATPETTNIEVLPIEGLTLPADFASSMSAALERAVTVTDKGGVRVALALARDPSEIEPLLEALSASLRKLLKGETVGPYR